MRKCPRVLKYLYTYGWWLPLSQHGIHRNAKVKRLVWGWMPTLFVVTNIFSLLYVAEDNVGVEIRRYLLLNSTWVKIPSPKMMVITNRFISASTYPQCCTRKWVPRWIAKSASYSPLFCFLLFEVDFNITTLKMYTIFLLHHRFQTQGADDQLATFLPSPNPFTDTHLPSLCCCCYLWRKVRNSNPQMFLGIHCFQNSSTLLCRTFQII